MAQHWQQTSNEYNWQSWDVLIEYRPATGSSSAFVHTLLPEPPTLFYIYIYTHISCQLTIQCYISSVVDTTLHNNYTQNIMQIQSAVMRWSCPSAFHENKMGWGWWGSRGIAPFILKLCITWTWMTSFMLWLLYSQGKNAYHELDRRLCGSQSLSATLLGIKTRTFQSIA